MTILPNLFQVQKSTLEYLFLLATLMTFKHDSTYKKSLLTQAVFWEDTHMIKWCLLDNQGMITMLMSSGCVNTSNTPYLIVFHILEKQ